MNADFKQKHWDEKQKNAVAQVARSIEEFETLNGSSKFFFMISRIYQKMANHNFNNKN